MPGSDEEELDELDELDGAADATVSLPVDEALAAALDADEAEEEAQPTAHETVRPPGGLPATKVNAYGPRVSFEEPTFINDAQQSAEIALAAESAAAELSAEPPAAELAAEPPVAELSAQPLSAELAPRVDASPAQPARERPSLGGLAVRGVIVVAMALGVGVIGHHLATAGAQPTVGPLRLVAGAEAHVTPRPPPRIEVDPEDASRPIPELERAAAEALGAGRLEEAARRYAALARRVPHQPAYAAAARVLAAQVLR